MNLTKCNNGHFYDADRYFDGCPHCQGASPAGATVTMPIDVDVTVPDTGSGILADPPVTLGGAVKETTTASTPVNDEQKTIGIFNIPTEGSVAPVVGWLVCVKGVHYGEDFRLVAGRNFVGRNSSMEVCLSKDNSISREKHLIIVFEPKQNTFILQPGDSKELSYLNDEVILQAKVMQAGDSLVMGNSQFVFVPFCTSEISWKDFPVEE